MKFVIFSILNSTVLAETRAPPRAGSALQMYNDENGAAAGDDPSFKRLLIRDDHVFISETKRGKKISCRLFMPPIHAAYSCRLFMPPIHAAYSCRLFMRPIYAATAERSGSPASAASKELRLD